MLYSMELKIKILTTLLLLCTVQLRAQISLEEYREQVVDFSLSLRLYDERIASAEASYELAQRSLMPSLSIDGSFQQLIESNTTNKSWGFNVSPKITQVIYDGGGLRATVKRADIERDIELCDNLYTLSEVEYAAEYAYWNLMAMGEYLDITNEYYNTITALEEVVEMRYREGYVSKGDWLMMQTRLSEAIYSKTASQESYIVAIHNFNILRGEVDINKKVELTTHISSSPPPKRVPLNQVLNQRADYTSLLLSEEYAQKGIALAKSSYNPSLSIGVMGVWQPYLPNITGKTYLSGVVALDISIPIFNFGARYKAVDVAKRTYNQSQINTSILSLEITKEESNAWTTLSTQYAQMNHSNKSLTIASENLEISTYSYQEGLTTILDVMAAQVSWLQLYSNAIAAEFAYMVAVAEYRKVSGEVASY